MEKESASRRRLLETAADLIARSSYGAVGVEEICERASVHKGSFYHFFPTKADLAVAALEDHWKRTLPEKLKAFASEVPPIERIAAWCRQMRRNQAARKNAAGMVLGCPYTSLGSELSTTDDKVRRKCREIAQRTCGFLETAIREAQKAGDVPRGDVARRARELYAFAAGALQQAKINDDLSLLDDMEAAMLRLLGARERLSR